MRLLPLVLLLLGCSTAQVPVGHDPPRDLRTLGRLLAEHFDDVNGIPIEVDPRLVCPREEPICLSLGAAPLVQGFAESKGIPVVVREGPDDLPKCDWSGVEDEATGLRVSFSQPEFESDAARVTVHGRCDGTPARRGFLHATEFIFSWSAAEGWVFRSIGLLIIS